jgi:hypothetical protein
MAVSPVIQQQLVSNTVDDLDRSDPEKRTGVGKNGGAINAKAQPPQLQPGGLARQVNAASETNTFHSRSRQGRQHTVGDQAMSKAKAATASAGGGEMAEDPVTHRMVPLKELSS